MAVAHPQLMKFIRARSLELLTWLREQFYSDYKQWPLWVPILLSLGIAAFFETKPDLPLSLTLSLVAATAALTAIAYRFQHKAFWPLLLFFVMLTGFTAAQVDEQRHNQPQLTQTYSHILIQGTVTKIEHTNRGKVRVTLQQITDQMGLGLAIPDGVRLSLYPSMIPEEVEVGTVIESTVSLMPIPALETPGLYDFGFQAYYQGITGLGFAKSRLKVIEQTPPQSWIKQKIQQIRETINTFLKANLAGEAGLIAMALITGDRAEISQSTRDAFAGAGIAHILAISGLHMAIVAGFIFFFVRGLLALIQPIALRFDTKKIAAFMTILCTSFYVALCWQSISARRAYLMIVVAMIAIMINRNALSMRTLMFAAVTLLIFSPHALYSVSFQMSFAAVLVLIAAYEMLRNQMQLWLAEASFTRRVALYFGGILFTSTLATLATAPLTLYTFQKLSLHGLWTNLIAIPLTSFLVMPAAALSVLLMPLGNVEALSLVLNMGLNALIDIAHFTALYPEGILTLAKPSLLSLLFVVMGVLWVALWRKPWRKLGVVPVVIGLMMTFSTQPQRFLAAKTKPVYAEVRDNKLHVYGLRKNAFLTEQWASLVGHLEVETHPLKERDK